MNDDIWVCADGKEINIMDMDIDHLRNIVRMFMRYRLGIGEFYGLDNPFEE